MSLWTEVRRQLEGAGVELPVNEARMIVEAGAKVSRLDILTDPHRALSDQQASDVLAIARRRAAREPLAQILGVKAFWNLSLAVDRAVLTPRPETEFLVEAVLKRTRPDQPARLLDLGIGSGAIALAILQERAAFTAVGVDRSEPALAVAAANAESLKLSARLRLAQGDWWAALGNDQFDVVVSNPPYIPNSEIETLAPEVKDFEPRFALAGGEDGLDAYRAIFATLGSHLVNDGFFALELGAGQQGRVQTIAEERGFQIEETVNDLAGIPRVIVGRART